jgi:hypothetical protein
MDLERAMAMGYGLLAAVGGYNVWEKSEMPTTIPSSFSPGQGTVLLGPPSFVSSIPPVMGFPSP